MKTRFAASVLVSLLGLAQVASAQTPDGNLTSRERAWGEQLGAALGMETSQVRRPKGTQDGQTSGVTTWLQSGHGGTFAGVTRLKFRSPESAALYAFNVRRSAPEHDTAIEVRGDQVVIVVGQVVTSPEAARKLTQAAWGGLPAPDGPADTALVALRDGSRVVTTAVDGPFRRLVEGRLASDRRHVPSEAEQASACKVFPDRAPLFTALGEDAVLVRFVTGERAGRHLLSQAAPDGASEVDAPSAESYARMVRYREALRAAHSHGSGELAEVPPNCPTPGPAVGAANVVEGLFGP
jgi:hypothetical protein